MFKGLTLVLISLVAISKAYTQPYTLSFDESRLKQIADSRYWLLLTHSRPATFTKFKSQVSNSPFFLAPDGRTNPLAELKATLEFFQSNRKIGRFQQSPQCAFPERYRFLKKELNLQITDSECPDLRDWLAGFSGDSATLVYSAAFPNNPASIFGHTLLRINSSKKRDSKVQRDLLDYSVSYAAAMRDENPLELVFKGLLGGFEGIITVQPYYMKVNEYVSTENRDLWEYDLNLGPAQIENMLRHVWELQNSAVFNYYFIDENCAYFLLALLEIANPDWELVTQVPLYLSPAQSIKIVYNRPGVVTGIHFRPSTFKIMSYRIERLNREELANLSGSLKSLSLKDSQSGYTIATIDAALDYLQYLRAEKKGKQTPEEKSFYRDLLLARAKMDDAGLSKFNSNDLNQDSRPDQSHNAMQIGTSFGLVNNRLTHEIHSRMGLSDFVNDDTGLTPHSSMRWLNGQIRIYENPGSVVVENLELLQVRSLFPRSEVHRDLSWGIGFDYVTPHDLGCDTCKAFHVEGSAGMTWNLNSTWTQAILFTTNAEVGGGLQRGYRIGPSLDFETVLDYSKKMKTHLLFRHFYYGNFSGTASERSAYSDLLVEHGWTLSQSWDLRAKFRWMPPDRSWETYSEFFLGANFYFN